MNGIEVSTQASSIASLEQRAVSLRRHVLRMGERVGQGYVGQGLGIADLLAVLYFGEMKYDPNNLAWSDRDRFLLSIGHYSIGLYAALAEAGVITVVDPSSAVFIAAAYTKGLKIEPVGRLANAWFNWLKP